MSETETETETQASKLNPTTKSTNVAQAAL